MSVAEREWICCHLGAREHYAVPRALHLAHRLSLLVTDAWLVPGTVSASIGKAVSARLAQRFHQELADASVRSLTGSLMVRELSFRLQRRRGWDVLMARNAWFQASAARVLRSHSANSRAMVFAHSYSARQIFAEAKRRGWSTVLGQIDPGPEHYRIQQRLADERPEFGTAPPSPPPEYFDQWREECGMADWIVVNSDWSRESLLRAGIPASKLVTIALSYEAAESTPGRREYPEQFSAGRPLRALFVGTASVAKGVGDLLGALDRLGDAPIELRLVGDRAMQVPARFAGHPRIQWVGPVDRATVMEHYRAADLLVFPSHSDGFGMAQIEAQGWALPILASRHCGRVVRDADTGMLLSEVTPVAIADALKRLIAEPATLARFSSNMRTVQAAGLRELSAALVALEAA